jgi:hypothetical protein
MKFTANLPTTSKSSPYLYIRNSAATGSMDHQISTSFNFPSKDISTQSTCAYKPSSSINVPPPINCLNTYRKFRKHITKLHNKSSTALPYFELVLPSLCPNCFKAFTTKRAYTSWMVRGIHKGNQIGNYGK